MSFQPVLSACVLKDLGASLYIDTDLVLRSTGAVVPAGLAGLTDCVELRSSNGVDFAVRRRDGSVLWCYRSTSSTYLYREFKPGDVLDGVVLGIVEEAEAADLAEDNYYSDLNTMGASLTLRDKNGRVFYMIGDRAAAPRIYAHERLAASGALVKAVSVGAGMYVGSDGGLVYLSEQSAGGNLVVSGSLVGTGYQSVSGFSRVNTRARLMAIKSDGVISQQMQMYGDNPLQVGNAAGWSLSSYTALVVRSYGVARMVPGATILFSANDKYTVAGAILQSGGKRFVASFWQHQTRKASVLAHVVEAPMAVALWEYGYITAGGAVIWNTPKSGNYSAAGVPVFFGPLTTDWSARSVIYGPAEPSLAGQASLSANLVNKVDDFVCYFTAESGFSALFQSLLTIEAKFESVGTMAVRWSPEYGNIVQVEATFAAVGVLSASFSIVTTPATVASFAGVCVLTTSMQVERTLTAAFEGLGKISALLDDESVFRDGVAFAAAGAFSARMEIGRVFPDAVVRLFRKVLAGGMSVEPYNDVTLRGARYRNARWTREGTIPLGLNWGSSPDGLRFWGTPQETGEMSAIFEGPYPDGFQSNLTDAGQQSGGVVGCANLNAVGSFLVDRYEVKFIVEEVPADTVSGGTVLPSDFTLGEVLAELLTNASSSQWATRSAWTSGVRIGTRGGTASVASSNSAASVPASVPASKKPPLFYTDSALVQAGLLTPTDMAASDWKFALPAATPRGRQGVLRTAGVVLQAIATETDVNYADYVGEALDGHRRVCAFQSEIPLLPGVSWGEFYLRAAFSGHVSILFYTTQAGALTPSLAARLGVKTFARVQESTASRYRGAREGLGYDFASSETMQVCRASLPMEGRHGVYRLHVPSDIPPGTMANLSIFVKEGA
jgi:hypothetical protein